MAYEWIGAAAAAATAGASLALSHKINSDKAKTNWKYNKKAMDYENQINLQNQQIMWDKYNSPEARMNAFRKAGLNPNLVYEQGASGQAMSVPGVSSKGTEYYDNSSIYHSLDQMNLAFQNYMQAKQMAINEKVANSKVETDETARALNDAKQQELFTKTLLNKLTGQEKEIALNHLDKFWALKISNMENNNAYNQLKTESLRWDLMMRNKYEDQERLYRLQEAYERVHNIHADTAVKKQQKDMIIEQINDLLIKQKLFYPAQIQAIYSGINLNSSLGGLYGAQAEYYNEKSKDSRYNRRMDQKDRSYYFNFIAPELEFQRIIGNNSNVPSFHDYIKNPIGGPGAALEVLGLGRLHKSFPKEHYPVYKASKKYR